MRSHDLVLKKSGRSTSKGIKVPNGFAITAAGYWYFLCESGLDRHIDARLANLDPTNLEQLQKRDAAIRNLCQESE